MNASDFSFHWFDLIVVAVLIVGILRGSARRSATGR
jgi:hypothetical protein